MKTLKNKIRENLLEIKETKKENLVDSGIVKNRMNRIVQESKSKIQLVLDLLSERKKLVKIGVKNEIINENLVDLFRTLYSDEKGANIINSVKDTGSEHLIKKLNLENNSLIANSITKVFKNQPNDKVSELFSKSNCDDFCSKVSEEIVKSFGIKDTNHKENMEKSIKLELKLMVCGEVEELESKMENKFSQIKEKVLKKT